MIETPWAGAAIPDFVHPKTRGRRPDNFEAPVTAITSSRSGAWISSSPSWRRSLSNLRGTIMLPGCGHWTQQERPTEVNGAIIDFLRKL